MRLLIAALALTVMIGGALAQTASPGSHVGQNISKLEADADRNKPKAKADEKAYNAALRTLPNKQYDPWRGVR